VQQVPSTNASCQHAPLSLPGVHYVVRDSAWGVRTLVEGSETCRGQLSMSKVSMASKVVSACKAKTVTRWDISVPHTPCLSSYGALGAPMV
jgi:hypothetical protein